MQSIKVTPDRNGKWKYVFTAPKYETDGVTEIKYTVSEKIMPNYIAVVSGYNIENIYIPPSDPGDYKPPSEPDWHYIDNLPNESDQSGPGMSFSPQTGDNSEMFIWFALVMLLASAAVMMALKLCSKR